MQASTVARLQDNIGNPDDSDRNTKKGSESATLDTKLGRSSTRDDHTGILLQNNRGGGVLEGEASAAALFKLLGSGGGGAVALIGVSQLQTRALDIISLVCGVNFFKI